MRSKIVLGLFAGCCLLLFGVTAFADSFTFDIIPSAPAPAGSTVGWGYSIANDSLTNWLVTTLLNADPFVDGTPTNLFDFPILAPGAVASLSFDALNASGFYQFTWDTNAPAGSVNGGNFTLSAEWWDGDPFDGGNFLFLADDENASFSTSVSSISTGNEPVPEPSTLLLLLSGLTVIYGTKRKFLTNRR